MIKRKIKKIIRKIKQHEYNKKILFVPVLLIFFLSIMLYRNFVKAYPGSWDSYVENDGIFSTILQYEKSKMDLIKQAGSYKTVHDTSATSTDKYQSDEGKTYYYAHGKNYEYTNTTVDTTNKWKSRWFLSPYGPFLDYIQNKGSVEANSIQFSEEGSLYKNSDHVYVATDNDDFGDAKSLAATIYDKGINSVPPLLINSDSQTLSDNVKNEARSNGIKNLVVLGGSQIYKTMFSIGEDFNIIRIGGAERNDTYNLINITENSSGIYNVSTKPITDSNGIVCDIKTDQISSYKISKIKNYLNDYDFKDAADLVLNDVEYGNTSDINSSGYQVLIGCKDSATSTKTKFLKVYYLKNNNGYQYGVYQYIGQDYFSSNTQNTGDLTVNLTAPSRVYIGDDVNMSGTGEDKDKDNTKLSANIWVNNKERTGVMGSNPSNTKLEEGTKDKKTGEVSKVNDISFDNYDAPCWFSEEGLYHANSNITDSKGATAKSDIKPIVAIHPLPKVRIDKTGTEKQNRKLTIDASNSDGGCDTANGNARWLLDWSTAKWTITPVNGANIFDFRIQTHTEGSTNGTILYDPSRGVLDLNNLNGVKTFDVLCKNPEQFIIKCTITNNCTFNDKLHYTNSGQIALNFIEDAVPMVNFWAPSTQYRNPNDNNSDGFAQFTEPITDDGSENNGSYSTDGDYIGKRLWLYAFDSNNDGNYKDEIWYYYNITDKKWNKLGTYEQARNADINSYDCGNQTKLNIKGTHVGKDDMELIIQEEFGQDYIPQFVTSSDRKVANSFEDQEKYRQK